MEEKRMKELEACTITFLEGDVVHVHFKDGRTVLPEEVQAMFDTVEAARAGRKFLLMVSVGVGASLTNEARVLASAEGSNRYIAADAIVVRDFGHQLAANVFVRHNKPGRPVGMFPDVPSALAWLSQHHHLIDQP
jgi:hypothetical protein